MKKFATEIIGSDILVFQQHANVGKVEEIIIDPKNGNFLGISFTFQKASKVIPISEMVSFGPSFIVVREVGSITDPEDVVRLKSALDFGAKIIGEKVETESGQKLGKVTNYTLDLKNLALDKIYVGASIAFNFLAKDLIISTKNILEIKKDKIVVTDTYARSRRKAPASIAISPALD